MGRILGSVDRQCRTRAQNEADEGLCGPHGGDQRADAQDVHDALEIVGQHVQGHLGADLLERFIWKWVAPIHDLIVPNGCSTVLRRM